MENVKLIEELYGVANAMIEDGQQPFAVAASFVLAGLQMYRTSLSDDEYDKMVAAIYEARGRVRSLEEIAIPRTLN